MLRSLSRKNIVDHGFNFFRHKLCSKSAARRGRINFSKSSILSHKIISYRDLSDLGTETEELGQNALDNFVGLSNNPELANFSPNLANSENLHSQNLINDATSANRQQTENYDEKFSPENKYEFLKLVLNKSNYKDDGTLKISANTLILAVKGATLINDSHGFVAMFDKWWGLLYDRLHQLNSHQIIGVIIYLGHVNKLTDGALRQVLHRWHIQALETQFLVSRHTGPQDYRYYKLIGSFCDLHTPKDYFSPFGFPSKQTIAHVLKYYKENTPKSAYYYHVLSKTIAALAALKSYPEYDELLFLTNLYKQFFDLFPPKNDVEFKFSTSKSAEKYAESRDSASIIEENIEINVKKPENKSRDHSKIVDQSNSIENELQKIDFLARDLENLKLNEEFQSKIDDPDLTPVEKSIDSDQSRDHTILESRDDQKQIDISHVTEEDFEIYIQTFTNVARSFTNWSVNPDHVTPGFWDAWFNGVKNLLELQKLRRENPWPEKPDLSVNNVKLKTNKNFQANGLIKMVTCSLEVAHHFDKLDEFFEIQHLCNGVLFKVAGFARDENISRLLEAIQLCESGIRGKMLSSGRRKSENAHLIKNAAILSYICNKAERYDSYLHKQRNLYKRDMVSKTNQSEMSSGKSDQSKMSSTKLDQSETVANESLDLELTNNNNAVGNGKVSGQEFFDTPGLSIASDHGKRDKAKLYE